MILGARTRLVDGTPAVLGPVAAVGEPNQQADGRARHSNQAISPLRRRLPREIIQSPRSCVWRPMTALYRYIVTQPDKVSVLDNAAATTPSPIARASVSPLNYSLNSLRPVRGLSALT